MPQARSKPLEMDQRRGLVSELYLQSWTQAAIGQELGVSQKTISNDLKAIRQQWRDSAIRDFDMLREIELQKVDRIEREAWAAWERSKKPNQSAVVKEHSGQQTTHKTMQQRVGDPRYLELVSRCVMQRRAILGLDLALVTNEAAAEEDISLEVRRERVVSIMATLRNRVGTAGTGAAPGPAEPGQLRATGQRRALAASPPPDVPE